MSLGPVAGLLVIVAAVLIASRQTALQPLFRWLPIPLWCYAIPAASVALGWLPSHDPSYRALTDHLLPFALGLLLLGVNLPSILQVGRCALLAAGVGAAGIVLGAPLGAWLLRGVLPTEAWKGAGALAGTWTGGTMNLLALRSVLQTPDAIFAPLIVVDAVIAYTWMALLVAASAFQRPIDQWLRAAPVFERRPSPAPAHQLTATDWRAVVSCTLSVVCLSLGAGAVASRLPASSLVTSSSGWTVLLITTATLGLSLLPAIRRIGEGGSLLGYPSLYLVLAATGAQASLSALESAPMWLVLGAGVALFHGGALLLAGRLLRIPLGVLATASQANIGGLVSAPLVGAVYDQSLAPVGLLLAMAGNALGTYLGWLSATLCRWLTPT